MLKMLALVAIFAMSAMAASAASAATFTSGASTTILTAEDEGVVELNVTGVGVTCSEVSYTSHVTSASTESVTTDPSYKGCKTSLGSEARVTGFGDWGEEASKQCDFNLKANGNANLSCPAGSEVTVEAATCTVHMSSAKDVGTITYTTDTTEGVHSLTLHLNIVNIPAIHTDGFLCPLTGSGESESAKLTGTIKVWGENEAGVKVAITHDA